MTTTTTPADPGDRYVGQAITPELLRAEALRLDATNAGGAASWIMGEVACLLRRTADRLGPEDPFADWPPPEPAGYGTTSIREQCRQWDREANGR